MRQEKIVNLHLVCDSTGEVLGSISRFVSNLFAKAEIKEYFWYLTKTRRQVDDITTTISRLRSEGGGENEADNIIISCFAVSDIEDYLIQSCKMHKIAIKSATKNLVNFVGLFCKNEEEQATGKKTDNGLDSDFGKNYLNRIEAIEYTIAHDDGNLHHDLDEADILLIGPSRTSKTPVSVYLSYRGFKVANIPFVSEDHFDVEYIKSLKKTLIVGLTINPERLENIRKTRLQHIGSDSQTSYTDIMQIEDEVKKSKRLFAKLNCFVIDVTQKSVEETCAYITTLHNKTFGG